MAGLIMMYVCSTVEVGSKYSQDTAEVRGERV